MDGVAFGTDLGDFDDLSAAPERTNDDGDAETLTTFLLASLEGMHCMYCRCYSAQADVCACQS